MPCGLKQADARELSSLLSSECVQLSGAAGKDAAAGYEADALECFARVQRILATHPQERVLVQVVVNSRSRGCGRG